MAGPAAAALGPLGLLSCCACCAILAAIWGLFATTIALAVYTKRWVDAVKKANGISGAEQMIFSQGLLIGVLCIYGYLALRRALRSAN